MTEKLYGLDDIPEGWGLFSIQRPIGEGRYLCMLEGQKTKSIVYAKTPQLALHKAIQKAKGEV